MDVFSKVAPHWAGITLETAKKPQAVTDNQPDYFETENRTECEPANGGASGVPAGDALTKTRTKYKEVVERSHTRPSNMHTEVGSETTIVSIRLLLPTEM